MVIGDPSPDEPVLVRIHSQCFTGDLLASLRCDCGEQLRGGVRLLVSGEPQAQNVGRGLRGARRDVSTNDKARDHGQRIHHVVDRFQLAQVRRRLGTPGRQHLEVRHLIRSH